uniref:ZAD domain-containing protein n=1 Tax=Stomoxys calcitrans TaxID=35570 RepID=A0A1I8NLJ7_STOCA
MSENSSEYLKRTCLICGCHTNQTINIYEPRSGPNIVQLIQAKFKFQPLNEDKYLCFSCNNWLINWHSLQALNSNDAESPSGTFRSHLNSGNVMQDEKSSGSKKHVAVYRPIARVSPQNVASPQQHEETSGGPALQTFATASADAVAAGETQMEVDLNKLSQKINFNKRHFRAQLGGFRRGRLQHKTMQLCACGKLIVIRRRSTKHFKPREAAAKCSKCRELTRIKSSYMRSIVQVERELALREAPLLCTTRSLASATDSSTITENQYSTPTQTNEDVNDQQQHLYLPKPLVDGKVVAMLRRLGTHLSRESPSGSGNNITATERLPQIMSPTKSTSFMWQRSLEDDEILLNFDASISEVLPSLVDQITHVNSIAARKRLTFQVSETAEVVDLCEEDDVQEEAKEVEDNIAHAEDYCTTECKDCAHRSQYKDLASTFNLPKGLSITLA